MGQQRDPRRLDAGGGEVGVRDYHAKRGDKIPERAYRRALWHVRAYPHIVRDLDSREPMDKLVHMTLQRDRVAVESALSEVPEEFRAGILDNILDDVPLERLPHAAVNTWSHWRRVFLRAVAENMHWM